jgi:hypothetical protein
MTVFSASRRFRSSVTPDDLFFVYPLSQGIFIPPENPSVWNSFAFGLVPGNELLISPGAFSCLTPPEGERAFWPGEEMV